MGFSDVLKKSFVQAATESMSTGSDFIRMCMEIWHNGTEQLLPRWGSGLW